MHFTETELVAAAVEATVPAKQQNTTETTDSNQRKQEGQYNGDRTQEIYLIAKQTLKDFENIILRKVE